MRGRLVCGVVLLLVCWAASTARGGTDASQERRPNVVVFLVDDLGWRDTRTYGSTFYETPNVDRLASRGMKFTNAYAANPLCSPTRASLLTGQYPCRLGITVPAGHIRPEVLKASLPERASPNHKAVTPTSANRLPLEAVTLAEVLKSAGYATAHIGKWHLGWEPFGPAAQGFDFVAPGGSYPGPPGSYFSPFKAPIFPDSSPGQHIDDLCTDAAIGWMKAHKDDPFFLNYWMFSVHAPYDGDKPELRQKYTQKADPTNPQRNPIMGAMIETMDACVGRVLDTIDELGLANDTIILFTGDNGGVSCQEVEGAPVTSNLPLRNGKASIYEGGTRENLVVIWPGKVEAGSTSQALVSSIDILPTLLEMVSVERPADLLVDGTSYVPVLTQTNELERDTLFCHFPHYTPASSNLPATWVRQGDWKLIRFYADGPAQTDRFELYNLAADLGENHNLAKSEPSRVKALNALIDSHLKDTQTLVPKPNPAYREEAPGWTGSKNAQVKVEGQTLEITSTGNDPFVMSRIEGKGEGPFLLEMRMRSTGQGEGRVYWTNGTQRGFALERSVGFPLSHGGAWQDYRVMIPSIVKPGSLRIDPGNAPGTISIKGLKLLDAQGQDVKAWPGKPVP